MLLNYIGKWIDVDLCLMIVMFLKEKMVKKFNLEKFELMVEVMFCFLVKLLVYVVCDKNNLWDYKMFVCGFLKFIMLNVLDEVKLMLVLVVVVEELDDVNMNVCE